MRKVWSKFKYVAFAVLSIILATGFLWQKNDIKQTYATSAEQISYITSDSYLKKLNVSGNSSYIENSSLENYYNLADYYPLVCENQAESDLCWAYASAKSLESALMVQRQEYYNFSEVGLAYLYYYNNYSSSTFGEAGDFKNFVTACNLGGLILESDFSNTEFDEIEANSSRYYYYSYILDYAFDDLNSSIKAYEINNAYSVVTTEGETENEYYYSKLTPSERVLTTKKFIKTYGGLFAGIWGGSSVGCFVNEQSYNSEGIEYFYDYYRERHDSTSYETLNGNHAVCIIGWNDNVVLSRNDANKYTGAFIAMNSWGYESDRVDYFYIPYELIEVEYGTQKETIYSTFCGFICDSGASEEVEIANKSSSTFTNTYLKGNKTINNYFSYNDNVSVVYQLDLSSLSNLKIKVTGGGNDYTARFGLIYDNTNKQVTISLNKPDEFYGGYYTINFYDGDELYAKRGIYVHSGTEIDSLAVYYSYIEAGDAGSTVRVFEGHAYELNGAFLNKNNTTTIFVSSAQESYYISVNLAYISSRKNVGDDWNGFNVSIKNILVTSANDISVDADNLFTQYSGSNDNYILQIGKNLALSNFDNAMISFEFVVESTAYEGCLQTFYVNMFVAGSSGASTEELNTITYFLDGGENNPKNITKFPNYQKNDYSQITSVDLLEPTKVGYIFVGWYTSVGTSGTKITKINSDLSKNIKLYAKWESQEGDYFDISLAIGALCDYDGVDKSVTDNIVYGDRITISLNFIEKSALNDLSYIVNVFYSWDGQTAQASSTLELIGDEGGNKVYKTSFVANTMELVKNLQSKDRWHSISVTVKVQIAGSTEKTEIASLGFHIQRKEVTFTFYNLEKTYNGQKQSPSVSYAGFFSEDTNGKTIGDLIDFECETNSKDAGTHVWAVTKIKNDNYTFDKDDAECEFIIKEKGITVDWVESFGGFTYTGNNYSLEIVWVLSGKVGSDVITFDFIDENNNILTECKNAGDYRLKINSVSNQNYKVENLESLGEFSFTIEKAKIRVELDSVTDRVQTKSAKRKRATYRIYGTYLSLEDVDVEIVSEAHNATKSGTYDITCRVGSPNYELDNPEEKATYTLTGYYYVYYRLSNGKVFTEKVEEGKNPTGVTKEDFDAPKFSKIKYSDNFYVTGEDIYVDVDLKDYTGLLYAGIFVGGFLLISLIYFIKKRESKVR